MPRDGNGSYNLPSDVNPVVPGTIIESTWANSTLDDVATGLTNSVAKDGQTTPTANLPMGGYKHTGVGDPTAEDQYNTLGVRRKGTDIRVTITGGVNDLVGTLTGLSAYTQYMTVSFVALYDNTDSMTVQIGSLAQVALTNASGDALVQGDIVAGQMYLMYYDGTKFRLISQPSSAESGVATQLAVTGWLEPDGGYPSFSVVSDNPPVIAIPEGTGVVVSEQGDVTVFDWAAQNIALSGYIDWQSTDYYAQFTVFMSSDTTVVVQDNQEVPTDYWSTARNSVKLCVGAFVPDQDGITRLSVQAAPSRLQANLYLATDVSRMVSGTLLSGGLLSPIVTAGPISRFSVADCTVFAPESTMILLGSIPQMSGSLLRAAVTHFCSWCGVMPTMWCMKTRFLGVIPYWTITTTGADLLR